MYSRMLAFAEWLRNNVRCTEGPEIPRTEEPSVHHGDVRSQSGQRFEKVMQLMQGSEVALSFLLSEGVGQGLQFSKICIIRSR